MREAFYVYSVNKSEVFCAVCFSNDSWLVLTKFDCSPLRHETNELETIKPMYKNVLGLSLVFAIWYEFEFSVTKFK
jgi:hypothetical protein